MKSTSRFAYASKSTGTQLLGLSGGMPSTKRLEGHVRANIIGNKGSGSYIKAIAKDIRVRSNQAAGGDGFSTEISNYYASLGLNPYTIAGDLQSKFPSMLPPSIKTEDVDKDSGLNRELEKLEGYLAGTYGSGPGYHSAGNYSFPRGGGGTSTGNGSSGGGTVGSSGGGSSLPDISSVTGGGNTMMWVIGAGIIGAVLLLKGRK